MDAALSHRRALFALAAVLYAVVFVAFVAVGSPALGVAHFFYLPVALVALATRPLGGVVAGVVAAALYATGIVLNPEIPPAEVLTYGSAIRLVNYCSTGALLGLFASRNRRLVEELRVLAERDAMTGLPNTRAFEAAIDRRLTTGRPFALLVGDLAAVERDRDEIAVNDGLIRLAEIVARSLPEADVARVGAREFAVLCEVASTSEASSLAGQLEAALASHGVRVTLGWALHPQEGLNALSLYRAADERLYARRLVTAPTPGTVALRSA